MKKIAFELMNCVTWIAFGAFVGAMVLGVI